MKIRKYIPDAITCMNLVSGCISVTMAFRGDLFWAAMWIIFAAVFDFLDGFAARLMKAYSPMGKELDSLSDVVSFGVAPGMILFITLGEACSALPYGRIMIYIPYLAFIIPAFSGLRLAKFNIDDRQKTSFLGLPVPANALFWASACYSTVSIIHFNEPLYIIVSLVLAFLSSLMLVSEIPMFSLKISSPSWKGNEIRYILVVCAVLFILLWRFLGLAGTIVLYVVLSFFNKKH